MGILRTIFALAVVFGHSGVGDVFVGRYAVQLFYIISGFLISYILNNNKNYKHPIKFYTNRILRLYPVYYIVAALSLCMHTVWTTSFFSVYQSIPFGAKALLVFSNLFLFGQDWVMFSGIKQGNLVFVTDFFSSDILLFHGLLIPQAWTIGVELSFYVIAPFVLRDRRKICCLLLASITLRIILMINGLGLNDPWTNRFFPSELALFLIGALSQQWLLPFWAGVLKHSLIRIEKIATVVLIIISITYFLIPLREIYKVPICLAIFVSLLPLAFIFQNRSPFDKLIGDLSYPLYIGHLLVVNVVTAFFQKYAIANEFLRVLLTVIISIIFAFILDRYVVRRVEKVRDRLRSDASTLSQTSSCSINVKL